MKRLIIGLIIIPLLFGMLYAVPYIFRFVEWLIKIDNTDFGFPLWLDLVVSIFSGIVTYFLVGILFDRIKFYDKDIMSKANTIIGIIVGFVIGVVVHIFLKYWFIIIPILGIFIICSIFLKKRSSNELF